MSELREKIEHHISACRLSGGYLLSSEEASKAILAAFKAHIEGCPRPVNPIPQYRRGYRDGVEALRKALMESLE